VTGKPPLILDCIAEQTSRNQQPNRIPLRDGVAVRAPKHYASFVQPLNLRGIIVQLSA
jgi:hypothetical protein